jgi:hypothetical protein
MDNIYMDVLMDMFEQLIEDELLDQALSISMDTHSDDLFKKTNDKVKVTIDKQIVKEGDDINDVCRICLDDMIVDQHIYTLECKHSFHSTCLDEAVERNHTKCPVCRVDLPIS